MKKEPIIGRKHILPPKPKIQFKAHLLIRLDFKRVNKAADYQEIFAVKERLLAVMPEILALSPRLAKYTLTIEHHPKHIENAARIK